MPDETELAEVYLRLKAQHDTLPFMTKLYPVNGMRLTLLPDDIRSVIESSPDYSPITPGQGAVWLQFSSGDDEAEMVIYRTQDGRLLYVMAPI